MKLAETKSQIKMHDFKYVSATDLSQNAHNSNVFKAIYKRHLNVLIELWPNPALI